MPRKMFTDMATYNLRMERALYTAIEAQAIKQGRSMNAEIIKALENWIRNYSPNASGGALVPAPAPRGRRR